MERGTESQQVEAEAVGRPLLERDVVGETILLLVVVLGWLEVFYLKS